MPEPKPLDVREVKKIKQYYAKRWLDPVLRAEDIFNVKRADGSLCKLKIPEPQHQLLRDGILGKSRGNVGSGMSYVSVTNKGRQLGFSVVLAIEAILIAEDFPNTEIFYVATTREQAEDWTRKVDQLCRDANHWPKELGGGPILNVIALDRVFVKVVNHTLINGLAANPSSIRGKTGIHVIFDEAAWAIRVKDMARETWKALKYIIRQGGSARIQSTPRTSDEEEFFWGMVTKGESGSVAIHNYYCPVISNWKDLDLNEPLYIDINNTRRKQRGYKPLPVEEITKLVQRYEHQDTFEIVSNDCIKQKAIVPYWWVSLQDLENDRATDLEQFKQENLGIPLDETYKLIKSEWIFSNISEADEIYDRGTSQNDFYMGIDLAQKNDLTAITIVECIDGIYVERYVEETQKEYTVQVDMIFDLYLRFKPKVISIDNTGHGVAIGDMLSERLKYSGANPNTLKRLDFSMKLKEQMAVGFRNLVMPDPISGKSRYRWLCSQKKHENAIRHCLRVEKELLPQGGIRYSGKMHGRDDAFWSKSMIALIEIPNGIPRAGFGRIKKLSAIENIKMQKSLAFEEIQNRNKKQFMPFNEAESQEQREHTRFNRMLEIRHKKNVMFAAKCLTNGIVICRTINKPVKPIHCAVEYNCTNKFCQGYSYCEEISRRYECTKEEIYDKQKIYPKKKETAEYE
jgi:phage FluMu gp28-like protein